MLKQAEATFSYYAYDKLDSLISQWQQKKEYETTAQFQSRVTEANRQQQLKKIVAELQKEYIANRLSKSKDSIWTIGRYDADYGTYPVSFLGATTYAKVPTNEAQSFKENFSKVEMYPQYGVVDDHLAILSCDFKLDGKAYHSAKTYSYDNASLAVNLPPLDAGSWQGNEDRQDVASAPVVTDHSIDNNIPTASNVSSNTFAVIIGNENYQRVAKVQYAGNDAKVFAEYCQKTLGIPRNNIRSYNDATYGTMLAALKDIQNIAKAYKGNLDVIFYYAGHGVPSETDQSAYLLPVDADGTQTEVCLSTRKLYQTLNSLNAKQVVVLMDACFSGAQRGEGMLASARGVALKVKEDVPTGNMVVFTAANGEQTAYPFKEKGHGMFTYFILKKLQDTKGNVTLGDLCDYVSEQVARQSVVVNKHSQTPTVIPATTMSGSWRTMKLQ